MNEACGVRDCVSGDMLSLSLPILVCSKMSLIFHKQFKIQLKSFPVEVLFYNFSESWSLH